MRYQRIYTQIWHDQKFRQLSADAKMLFFYCLTSPHSNMLGVFICPKQYILDDRDDRCTEKGNKMIDKEKIIQAEQSEKADAVVHSSPSDCYTSDFFSLYNQDCMEGMKQYPDNHFELAIVDPPYGIGASGFSNGTNLNRTDGWHREESTAMRLKKNRLDQGRGKLKDRVLNQSNCEWDTNPPDVEYFRELERVSVNRIIWGGNYFDLPPSRGMICWDKCQPWENFSQFELAWTSFDKPAAMFRYSNTGGANAERKIHPTQKPVKLYEWLIQKYAEPGYKILDTHLGSGSIAIACYNLDFHLTGYEIDTDYFQAMKHRIEEHMKQQRLFDSVDV